LLNQQQHWVGGIFAADADPLGGVSELHCIEPVDPHLSSPIVGVV
jgi:hypothetical protein